MIKFNNKIPLGVFAGIIGNLIKNIFSFSFYCLGYKEHTIWQFSSSAILPQSKIDNIAALTIGLFNDFAIASILGIITVYFIYFTGTGNYLLKGFIIGSAAWMLIFIPVTQLNISRFSPDSLSSNIIYLLGHLLLGILMARIIIIFGKKALKKGQPN